MYPELVNMTICFLCLKNIEKMKWPGRRTSLLHDKVSKGFFPTHKMYVMMQMQFIHGTGLEPILVKKTGIKITTVYDEQHEFFGYLFEIDL